MYQQKLKFIVYILFFLPISINGQSLKTDIDFAPKGYKILDTQNGDLNLDGYEDCIVILKRENEEETSNVADHPEKRPLFILLGQEDSIFKVVAKNDDCVYCVDCGGMMGDPYVGITIKNGYFSIEHYGGSGWRWSRIITFKYSKTDNNWFLHKDGGDNFHASEPEKVESKVQTIKDFGKIPFIKFDIYKDE